MSVGTTSCLETWLAPRLIANGAAHWWIRNPGNPSNRSLPTRQRESCIALGVFDGVHFGHRSMLSSARAFAMEHDLDFVAVTFDRHPRNAVGAGGSTPLLQSRAECVRSLFSVDVDYVLLYAFTKEFAAASPERFADMLQQQARPRMIFVGEDFRFGASRKGDATTLARLGQSRGFGVRPFPLVMEGGVPVSSTRIREAVARGDMLEATTLLGRPHSLTTPATRPKTDYDCATFTYPAEAAAPPAGQYLARVQHTSQLPVTVDVSEDTSPSRIWHRSHFPVARLEGLYSAPLTLEFLDRA